MSFFAHYRYWGWLSHERPVPLDAYATQHSRVVLFQLRKAGPRLLYLSVRVHDVPIDLVRNWTIQLWWPCFCAGQVMRPTSSACFENENEIEPTLILSKLFQNEKNVLRDTLNLKISKHKLQWKNKKTFLLFGTSSWVKK